MISQRRRRRLYIQLACFVAAITILWPLSLWEESPRFVTRLSPFIALCSIIALKTISIGVCIGLFFLLIALVYPRWFCRYACPVGLLLEVISRIGFQKSSWWTRLPPFGQYIALLTAIGAIVGYPIFLWMDPLAMFNSSLAVRIHGNSPADILAGLMLYILILLSITSGLLWCARLCPLGGILDLLTHARSVFNGKKENRLQETSTASVRRTRTVLVRRSFILGAAGIGLGLWARKTGAMRGDNAPLRPPGAAEELRFAGLCIRCNNCVRTCPTKILHPDTGEAGVAGFMAPVIRYENNYCLEDCTACTQICPSGALQSLMLPQKKRYVIGEALVDGSLCLLTLGRKDCDVCMLACPFEAIHIQWDEDLYVAYPAVDPNKCNGCGACEVACPTENIKAIRVWRRTDKQWIT
jgi:ferredoxin-type protein NapF